MILRKPYAFLIKHFRAIHIALATLLILIGYETNRIFKFFKEYIKLSKYLRIYVEPSIKSVGWITFLALLAALGILIAIFVLMNKKKKPTKYYVFSIIFYAILLIFFIFVNSQIYSLVQNSSTIKLVNLVRDLLFMVYLAQFPFIIICLIRGLGFNIKKFDFKSDLKDMDITAADSEEFELAVELDANDVKTKFRRGLRITKYIINENKVILTIVAIALSSYIVISLFLNFFVYNRVYSEGSNVKLGDFSIKVLDSYQTTTNYKLVDISKNKYAYYIIKAQLKNNSDKAKVFNTNNIKLVVGNEASYEIDTNNYSSFLDFGVGYSKQKIEPSKQGTYIFVFKVDNQYKKSRKRFEILKSITSGNGETTFNYAKIKVKPKNVSKVKLLDKASLGKTLEMKDTIAGNFNLMISEIDFANFYEYEYQEKINEQDTKFTGIVQPDYSDYYGKKVMRLKANINFSNISNEKVSTRFIGKFGQIRYVKDKKEYTNPFRINEIETTIDSEYKYIEVYEDVAEADNIYLDITIRNKKYTYILK